MEPHVSTISLWMNLLLNTGAEAIHGTTESNPGGRLVLIVVAAGGCLQVVGAILPAAALDDADLVIHQGRRGMLLVGSLAAIHLVGPAVFASELLSYLI